MYFYIVDPSKLNQKNFERVQTQLYSSLSEHRISGEISRVTTIRTVQQLVDLAFERGTKTLVTVGVDDTLQEVINCVKGRDITLAYIPLMDSELSRILGVHDIESAAKTIAARRIEQLDLGTVNNNWFFTRLSFGAADDKNEKPGGMFSFFSRGAPAQTFDLKFSADGKFNGTLKIAAGVLINARDNSGVKSNVANPTDSVLDLLVVPELKGLGAKKELQRGYLENISRCSVFHVSKIEISGPENLELRAGGKVLAKTPAIIEVLPKALKMIVGRDRTF